MISLWTHILSKSDQDPNTAYGYLKGLRVLFVQKYIDVRTGFQSTNQVLLNQVKLHMWGYGGYMMEESEILFPTLKDLKKETRSFLTNKELDDSWKEFHGLIESPAQFIIKRKRKGKIMFKNYLITLSILLASATLLFASSNEVDVILQGNEKNIGVHVFYHTLEVIPEDSFKEQKKVLRSFESEARELFSGKFDRTAMSIDFEKVEKALSIIYTGSKKESKVFKIIDSFIRDFSYPSNIDDCTSKQRDTIGLLLALITLKETEAFCKESHYPKGNACSRCHFPYSERKRLMSKTFYQCALCGIAKSPSKTPTQYLIVDSSDIERRG